MFDDDFSLASILHSSIFKMTAFCLIFALCVWLFVSVPKWVNSAKEEVEFYQELRDHSPAYADLTSISPIETYSFISEDVVDYIFCFGTLENNESLWIAIPAEEYTENLDPDFQFSEYGSRHRMPVQSFEDNWRVHGHVQKEGHIINAFPSNSTQVLYVDYMEHYNVP